MIIERSREDVDKLVQKWSSVLSDPLTGCKTAILLESKERWLTEDELSEVHEYYEKHFKHDSNNNPNAYLRLLIDNKLRNK